MAGNAMSRRASYMYGNLLPPDPKGQVGAGLGTTTSAGTVTLIPPTDIISETGHKETIDGLTYEFLMAPGSEAPAEMLWFIEEKNAISAAEDATHTLHNTYSLRGAKIREPLPWSKYLNQALAMWGDRAEVLFAQHHWPTWGNEKVVELLEKQRDLYRFINDETLRMANQGMTMREIAEQIELPESLATFWANRGYYGSLYHDVAATYVLYLGWFDGNPATLHELPPVEASKNYVEFMGGADAVLAKAKESYDKGDYRWVAQVVNHVVFADPDNQAAKDLQADALEQLGYQAESGPWRNFYLTGAKELREGVAQLPTPNTASPDTVRAMTLEMFFDYLGVRLNSAEGRGRDGDAQLRLRRHGRAVPGRAGKRRAQPHGGRAGRRCRRDGDAVARHAERHHPSADEAGGRDQLRRRQGRGRPGEAGGGRLLPRHLRVLVQHRDAERDQLTEMSVAGALIGHLPRVGQGLGRRDGRVSK